MHEHLAHLSVHYALYMPSIIDHRRGRVVVNLPGGEDYSRLDLCNDDVENNYQLLDKEDPGSKIKK